TMTAFVAITKAGGAFLPIDPKTPAQRLQQLIKSSGAVVVLVGKSSVNVHHCQLVIEGDNAPQYDPALPTHNPDVEIDPNDLAYMLFTSGSTGTPKGVLMEHAPLARRLAWLARTFNYGPKDVWLQSIQLTFDPSIIEICLPLTQGASIALPPPGQLAPTDIAHHAQAFGATSIIFVPTTLRYFNQNARQYPNLKLRVAISGGEVLHRDMAMEFVNQTGAQLYNLYGPTEACIFATAYHFDDKKMDDPLPIGTPVDDTRIYILDANRQPLPIGTIGEIFIGGGALARGYLNNQEITAQRFINDPFVAGERLYYSGDNGYWDHNGQVNFVGRIDNQIKLRGQRIEPAEIENALCELPQIKAAAVKKVDNELHGWLVLTTELDETLCEEIATELAHKLPDYMVPTGFTQITAMPRQTSGKLDYKSLEPNPPEMGHYANDTDQASTDLQTLLLKLFCQTLEQQDLGVKSDFFKNGGESLTALNLLSAIHSQIGQKLPLSLLLHNPTVMTLSNAIVQRHHGLMVELSKHEGGTPIYLAASGHGDVLRFAPLADALGGAYNLRMLQPPISDGYTAYNSIAELAQYFATLIEQQHHQSPPIIAGFSVGGIAALETARHLTDRGAPIDGLILIDTPYPMRMFSRNALWRFCGWLIKSLRLQELSINQRTMGSLFSDPGLNGQIAALNKYHPARFSQPTTLIISSGFSRWYRLLFKPWQRVFKNQLNEQYLDGFHGTLFAPEHVAELAKIIVSKNTM
ncbi:MAG: amino acid adenylation domain-containing protein, partial [Psychrosphaera sp.]|nr:amino acid adenylation domain-containing protein [Psychrosphaera sp.]